MSTVTAEQRDNIAALVRTAMPYLRMPRGSTIEDVSVALSDTSPVGVQAYFGTHLDPDTANGEGVLIEFNQRVGKCYELAGRALTTWEPLRSSRIVHGSISRGGTPRIGHAWLELDSVLIWEPITAMIHEGKAWRSWAGAWDEATYDLPTLRRHIANSLGYGRWHESRYP